MLLRLFAYGGVKELLTTWVTRRVSYARQ